jgi:hypothetical protein
MFAIEIDEVDGELHEERMHSFTWDDPHPFAWGEPLPAEKAFGTLRTATGHFSTICHYSTSGGIANRDVTIGWKAGSFRRLRWAAGFVLLGWAHTG